ncbi:iduronate 2-sulfatase-like [Sycon ciliatum]|uniref:iduronate 2-sulfatase-like n=1 Tax=Sycon ciliatum TaxID=27933 RepID=UPI0031F6DA93
MHSTTRHPALLLQLLLPALVVFHGAELGTSSVPPPPGNRKNVLFFAIDDLRPDLGTYGVKEVKSPNIDQLAAKSMQFNSAYCQVAVCSPSRTSLLTGRRPDTTRVWSISPQEYWRQTVNATTIPQYFKNNGYISIGMGKVFHPGKPNGDDDSLYSWSPEGLPYYHSPVEGKYGPGNKTRVWWEFEGFEDNQLPDGQIADNALNVLQELKKNKTDHGETRPFFLAVGFHKPHTPFYAPKKYFDMYPDASEISLPENPDPPSMLPYVAWSTWKSLDGWHDVHSYFKDKQDCFTNYTLAYTKQCRMPEDKTRELRRAYYAAMTYTDAQVGKVMSKLSELGYADDTIVVLWGDHGWQLGEHGEWAKFTNFEDATRVPFILHVPGITDNGMQTDALVELIDIYPTLTDLAELPPPELCPAHSHNITVCVEGVSVAPLLKDPQQTWKKAAFSQYPRPNSGLTILPNHTFPKGPGEAVMGYTVRTHQWRYTEWVRFNHTNAIPNWTEVWGRELYDHSTPSTNYNDENVNKAYERGVEGVIVQLKETLVAGWRDALPPHIKPDPGRSTA